MRCVACLALLSYISSTSSSSLAEALVFVVPLLFSESILQEDNLDQLPRYHWAQNGNDLPVRSLRRHANRLPAGVGRLEEVAQLLLEDLEALRAGCVCHAQDRTPEVEGVGDVGADGREDEEDEVDWVAEDCGGLC